MQTCTTFFLALIAAVWTSSAGAAPSGQNAQTSALKVVVIEGEDAINIIQQKTAVAPIVEVRDENDLPISGAVVTFAVNGGEATLAGGASSITMTTSAAGRAALAALNPIAPGSLQIQVSAAFQGQTAVATIAQTNVMTAAEAAQLTAAGASTSAGSSSGTASAAGAGGGGGGLSGTVIGTIAAAAGAGAVAASQLGGGSGDSDEPAAVQVRTFTGPFSGVLVLSNFCMRRESYNGILTIRIASPAGAPVDGTAQVGANGVVLDSTCAAGPQGGEPNNLPPQVPPLTGTEANLAFATESTVTFPPEQGGTGGTFTWRFAFTGSLVGNEITGTLTQTHTIISAGTGSIFGGSISYPVVLR